MSPTIPIALVDDHTLFRNALADLIGLIGGYDVVVQADHGQQYVQAAANGARVAVAIVDLHMPVMDGYDTIAWIREHQPHTRALALTFDNDEATLAKALRAGACGFLPKNVGRGLFSEALQQVATLGHYINEDLVERGGAVTSSAHEAARLGVVSSLSPRETEFIRMVCHETEPTYEEVAKQMSVTLNTVHGYREKIFHKFEIKSKAGLVIFAYKWGLLDR
ncbi:MAG TPA: response regulator transcription factor [Flavobacteriales bacterium]|nr:response regulator transcription factor [Flavobacteriales bacterium]